NFIVIWKYIRDIPEDQIEDYDVSQKRNRQVDSEVYDLNWSPNGKYLIAGCVKNNARIFNVEDGSCIHVLSDHSHFVQGVAWDPLGKFIATQSADRLSIEILESSSVKVYTISMDSGIMKKPECISTSARIVQNIPNSPDSKDKNAPLITKLYHDETLSSFFRRLEFSPDGSLLLCPSGLMLKNDKLLNTVNIYARSMIDKEPVGFVTDLGKPTIGVSCNPILFKRHENSETYERLKLPYRIIFAVASLDAVTLYDTQLNHPIAQFRDLHFTTLTDISWSQDGRLLIMTSTDGFCTIVAFEKNELGVQYSGPEGVDAWDRLIPLEESASRPMKKLMKSKHSELFTASSEAGNSSVSVANKGIRTSTEINEDNGDDVIMESSDHQHNMEKGKSTDSNNTVSDMSLKRPELQAKEVEIVDLTQTETMISKKLTLTGEETKVGESKEVEQAAKKRRIQPTWLGPMTSICGIKKPVKPFKKKADLLDRASSRIMAGKFLIELDLFKLPLSVINSLNQQQADSQISIQSSTFSSEVGPDSDSNLSTLNSGLKSCSLCSPVSHSLSFLLDNGEFNHEALKAHFKSEWHQLNLKRKIKYKTILSEIEFEKYCEMKAANLRSQEAKDDLSDLSSSGSDSEVEEVDEDNIGGSIGGEKMTRKNIRDGKMTVGSALVGFKIETTVLKELNLGKFSKNVEKEIIMVFYKQVMMKNWDEGSMLTELPKRINDKKWTLIIISSGEETLLVPYLIVKRNNLLSIRLFTDTQQEGNKEGLRAGNENSIAFIYCIFDHLSSDQANGKAKSAGSDLRRYNEQALKQEIHELIESWSEHILESSLIFVHAPGANRKTFDGTTIDLGTTNSLFDRIRSIPFTTRRPTNSEVVRCFKILSSVTIHELTPPVIESASLSTPLTAPIVEPPPTSVTEKIPDPPVDPLMLKLIDFTKRGKLDLIKSLPLTTPLSEVLNTPLQDTSIFSLLHLASSKGQFELIPYFLANGANPTLMNSKKKRAYDIAKDKETRDSFRRFIAFEDGGSILDLGWEIKDSGIAEPLTKEMEERQKEKEREKKEKEKEKKKMMKEKLKEKKDKAPQELKVEEKVNIKVEKKSGLGKMMNVSQSVKESTGMSAEMRMKLDREKR
ncbi:hypothetical protein HK096_008016, partial [Nowakowskiella sp. JEL0078]